MPSPLCRLCRISNSVNTHGLCHGCWHPEAQQSYALKLVCMGDFWRGWRELRHARRCLKVRNRENRRRAIGRKGEL